MIPVPSESRTIRPRLWRATNVKKTSGDPAVIFHDEIVKKEQQSLFTHQPTHYIWRGMSQKEPKWPVNKKKTVELPEHHGKCDAKRPMDSCKPLSDNEVMHKLFPSAGGLCDPAHVRASAEVFERDKGHSILESLHKHAKPEMYHKRVFHEKVGAESDEKHDSSLAHVGVKKVELPLPTNTYYHRRSRAGSSTVPPMDDYSSFVGNSPPGKAASVAKKKAGGGAAALARSSAKIGSPSSHHQESFPQVASPQQHHQQQQQYRQQPPRSHTTEPNVPDVHAEAYFSPGRSPGAFDASPVHQQRTPPPSSSVSMTPEPSAMSPTQRRQNRGSQNSQQQHSTSSGSPAFQGSSSRSELHQQQHDSLAVFFKESSVPGFRNLGLYSPEARNTGKKRIDPDISKDFDPLQMKQQQY